MEPKRFPRLWGPPNLNSLPRQLPVPYGTWARQFPANDHGGISWDKVYPWLQEEEPSIQGHVKLTACRGSSGCWDTCEHLGQENQVNVVWVLRDLPGSRRLAHPGSWAISFTGESPSSSQSSLLIFLSKNHSCYLSQDLADNCTSTAYPCLEGSGYNRSQQFLSTRRHQTWSRMLTLPAGSHRIPRKPADEEYHYSYFYWWGTRGSEKLSISHKITQPIRDKVGTRTQIVWPQCSHTSPPQSTRTSRSRWKIEV